LRGRWGGELSVFGGADLSGWFGPPDPDEKRLYVHDPNSTLGRVEEFSRRQSAGRFIRDQENRIRVAIDDLVEFLNVMGAE
jgi:hypothetical protein